MSAIAGTIFFKTITMKTKEIIEKIQEYVDNNPSDNDALGVSLLQMLEDLHNQDFFWTEWQNYPLWDLRGSSIQEVNSSFE